MIRDFSDVHDIVAAYAAAWAQGQPGAAYNVCSGVGRSIREVLDTLIDIAAIRVDITVAADRVRPLRRSKSGWFSREIAGRDGVDAMP